MYPRFFRHIFVAVEFTRPAVYASNYYDIGETRCMPRQVAKHYEKHGAVRVVSYAE